MKLLLISVVVLLNLVRLDAKPECLVQRDRLANMPEKKWPPKHGFEEELQPCMSLCGKKLVSAKKCSKQKHCFIYKCACVMKGAGYIKLPKEFQVPDELMQTPKRIWEAKEGCELDTPIQLPYKAIEKETTTFKPTTANQNTTLEPNATSSLETNKSTTEELPTTTTTKRPTTVITTRSTQKTKPTRKTKPTMKTKKTVPTRKTRKTQPTRKTSPTRKTKKTSPTRKTRKTPPTRKTRKTPPTRTTKKTRPTKKTRKTRPTKKTRRTRSTKAPTKAPRNTRKPATTTACFAKRFVSIFARLLGGFGLQASGSSSC